MKTQFIVTALTLMSSLNALAASPAPKLVCLSSQITLTATHPSDSKAAVKVTDANGTHDLEGTYTLAKQSVLFKVYEYDLTASDGSKAQVSVSHHKSFGGGCGRGSCDGAGGPMISAVLDFAGQTSDLNCHAPL